MIHPALLLFYIFVWSMLMLELLNIIPPLFFSKPWCERTWQGEKILTGTTGIRAIL